MTSSFTVGTIVDSWYDHVDSLAVIVPSLSEIRTKLHSENVKSCVAIGCGHGIMELPFLEHCMPNLSQFTAVEPDPDSAALLKTKLAERLPSVRSVVLQETVQRWRGVDQPVDAVLLFHVLYYLNPQERLALYKRLFDTALQSGSYVLILVHPYHTSGEPSASCKVMRMLKFSHEVITDREVLHAMLSVGFELCYERMYLCHMKVENLDDAFLSLVLSQGERCSLDDVRTAAKEVFGNSKQVRNDEWLAVFRKP